MNVEETIIVATSFMIVALSTLYLKLKHEKKQVDDNGSAFKEAVLEGKQVTLEDHPFEEIGEVVLNLQNETSSIGEWFYTFESFFFPVTFLFGMHIWGNAIFPGYAMENKIFAITAGSSLVFVNGKIQLKLKDRLWVENLADLYSDSLKRNYSLGCLEKVIVEGMTEKTRKGRVLQYRFIKQYAKQHDINDSSLFNVYLHVCDYKTFHGTERKPHLTKAESQLWFAIRKMVNYSVCFENKKTVK